MNGNTVHSNTENGKGEVASLGEELFQFSFVDRKLGGNCFNLIIPDKAT
jgi:hypothetical protein